MEMVHQIHAQAGAEDGGGRDGAFSASLLEDDEHFLHAPEGEDRDEGGTAALEYLADVLQEAYDLSLARAARRAFRESPGGLHDENVDGIEAGFCPGKGALIVEQDIARKKDFLAVSAHGARGGAGDVTREMEGDL